MTKINKIMMHGFKSFARKTEMVFGDNFNCILGPNGSGKSNVLDALCFVLGKAGAKGLRVEKASNLIYNGGKSKNPAQTGEVSIWFDNLKKTFPLDMAEIKITRIIKQSGQSVYKINDKTVTRQQILDLLSMAKINPDGYNIILQGDIIRFVEMSPVERRGIIEEIGGISIYEEKRTKALSQLEGVEEKLKESDIVLSERNSYLKELKKERDQAAKFKELDDQIKSNKATMLHFSIEKKQKDLSAVEKQISAARKEIEKISGEISKSKEDAEKKKEELAKINKEVEDKGDKEQIAIQKEIENIKISHAENKTRHQNLVSEIDKIGQRIIQLSHGKKEQEEKLERFEKQKTEFLRRIDQNRKELAIIEEKITQFKAKHKIEGAAEKEKEIEELDKKADSAQEEIQKLRIAEQHLIREKDRYEFQHKSIDEKIEKIAAVAEENKKELEKLRVMKNEFKKATVELNQKLNEDSSLASQLQNAKNKHARTEEELARLNAKNAGISEKIAGNEAIKAILQQKDKLKGVYGTVSELGEVSAEYSLAMEVAAGNRIRSIIVEDDKVAASCIRYLKENQLGTATFLPLNKIKAATIPESISTILKSNGVRGLAQDLITCEKKFKNAFSYVFGGAVVVDNIEVARRIGIGSAKMVTLDGDITEVSGAMQGGYRKKTSTGGFLEKEVTDQIKKKEEEVSDLSGIISTLEKRKTENEEAIDRLRNLKASLEGEIIKMEKALHLEGDDMDADRKAKKELATKIEAMEKEILSVQNKIGMLNQGLLDAKIKKQSLRAEINELKNPRLLAELNTFEQKKQELKDQTVRLDAESKSIITQIETILSPELENTEKIIKQHEKEKEAFTKELTALAEKIKKQEKEISEKEEKQKKFYSQFKELFLRRDKVNEAIKGFDEKVIRKEEEARRHEHKANIHSLESARLKTELSGLTEEFAKYDGVKILKEKPEDQIKKEISQFEKMAQDIGAVNMKALEIYNQVEEEYNKLLDKKKKLAMEKEDVLLMMNEIETRKKELFLNTFGVVNKNFGTIFRSLSTKGEAVLELENAKEPFEGGVTVSVKLSSKKFMDIRSLSGGEKTLTALALIFAIQEHEPASFYILDEVDAALDKRNAELLAELVRTYSKRAQYVMISHNDGVISEADQLYGVSMDTDGMSKVVTLKI